MNESYEPMCECGHVRDEHGGVLGTRCEINGCDCIQFDWKPPEK